MKTFTEFDQLLIFLVKEGKVSRAAAVQQLRLLNYGFRISHAIKKHYYVDHVKQVYVVAL